MARIGFLGIGTMGIGMANRLIAAGHQLTVFNRTAEKTRPLVEKGASFALTPRDAANDAEVIFAMVGDDEASEHVWMGARDGALAADLPENAIIIECSTLSYGWVMQLYSEVQKAGYRYIDCPVTGYPDMAAAGQLTLFIGAEPESLKQAKFILQPLCTEIIHFGAVGKGTIYKLIVNLMGSIQIASAAEGLLLAERAGLDLEKVNYAISKGAAASPQVVRNCQRMITGDHKNDIVFSGRWRFKDTIYGTRLAKEFGLDTRLGNTAEEIYKMLFDSSYRDENESKVMDVIRDKN